MLYSFKARYNHIFQSKWDQAIFDKLLIEWVVSCDQPFSEVEHPEFRALLDYVHHPSTTLKLPAANTVQRRVMKVGQAIEEELHDFFGVR